MMTTATTTIEQELELIRLATGAGSVQQLRAEDVVEFAESHPDSALHARFQWDDTEAALQWRLHQARNIIRVHVTVLPNTSVPTRVYVSLTPDRRKPGGGYSLAAEVLSDDERRAQLLADALAELNAVRRKYAALQELAGVFAAIDGVRKPEEAKAKAKASAGSKRKVGATA